MGKIKLNSKNNYDVVFNRYQARLKEIKDLIKMMTMKYDYEVEYGKGMKKIAESNISILDDWYIPFVNKLISKWNFSF